MKIIICPLDAHVKPLGGERYHSYLKLKKESEYHAMSYMDKRKKDKAFGRFVKSAKKYMKA